jgi:regulatory protein
LSLPAPAVPTVTAIGSQKKKKDRFNIYINGKFRFGLDAETVVKSGLKVGQDVSKKEIEKLVLENEANKLMEKALRFLSFRPRSEREIRNHLKSKPPHSSFFIHHSPDEVINNVLDRLERLGYVDDFKFSQWWVEQRQTHKPSGQRLIRNELYQKGIDKKIIDQVLPDDEESEIERALKAAEKKLRSYEKLDRWKFKQKMGQYLARRGFEWEVIKETIDRLKLQD